MLDEVFIHQILGEDPWDTDQLASVYIGDWEPRMRVRMQVRMARCEIPQWITETGIVFHCHNMGQPDPLGRHLCARCWHYLWHCAGCGVWLPEGRSGYCSPACTQADHATQTWLGQLLGARYTTPTDQ